MEIPGGGGSTVKPPGTENPGGWGVILKKTLHGGGGMDIIWIHTMAKFENTLKGIFNYHHFSPKCQRELKEINHLFETKLAHFSVVKQVGWLASKECAVSALKRNLATVVLHVEHRHTERTRAEDSNRAKGYHIEITSVSFIKMLYFCFISCQSLQGFQKFSGKKNFLLYL